MSSRFGDFYQKHYRASEDLPEMNQGFDFTGEETRHPIMWFFLGSLLLIILPLMGTLYYYFGPSLKTFSQPEERQSASVKAVHLRIGQSWFKIPSNYLRFRYLHRGGDVSKLSIYVRWPQMSGYSIEDAEEFNNRDAGSQIVYITITAPERVWSAQKRLDDIYPIYFAGKAQKGPYGLTKRRFKAESGYKDDDLFYASGKRGLYLVHCKKTASPLAPPDCYRDIVLSGNTLVQYRFRRAMLKDWRALDRDILNLLGKFRRQ